MVTRLTIEFVLSFAAVFLCLNAVAEESGTASNLVIIPDETRTTNQDFMHKNPFSVAVSPLGMVTLAAMGRGVGVGYAAAKRRQLIANYFQGEIDQYLQKDFVAFKTKGDVKFAEFSLRSFVTESFYADLGLSYRQLTVDLTAYDNDQWVKSNLIIHNSRYLGALFSVGNQWYWDRVTIGVAWIGGFLPAYKLSLSQKERISPKWAVGSESEEQRRQVAQSSKSLDLRAFTTSIGMLF